MATESYTINSQSTSPRRKSETAESSAISMMRAHNKRRSETAESSAISTGRAHNRRLSVDKFTISSPVRTSNIRETECSPEESTRRNSPLFEDLTLCSASAFTRRECIEPSSSLSARRQGVAEKTGLGHKVLFRFSRLSLTDTKCRPTTLGQNKSRKTAQMHKGEEQTNEENNSNPGCSVQSKEITIHNVERSQSEKRKNESENELFQMSNQFKSQNISTLDKTVSKVERLSIRKRI